jgi:predicted nucleotidyltransferase
MTALTVDKIKNILTPLFEKQMVLKAVVFGSFARKTHFYFELESYFDEKWHSARGSQLSGVILS